MYKITRTTFVNMRLFKIKLFFFYYLLLFTKKYNLLRHYLKCITTLSFIAGATLHAWEPWSPVS